MYVIGTSGHVDHGKSTLVEALTGIDPDRLIEEKQRGLTIELGFAWLTLPSGLEVSIVDVPGHELFIKNMLAGVGGIDLALLIVAANESVMPQTREHLAILDLLGVRNGLAVIAKSDLVDEEMLELVSAEVEDVLSETTLENIPIMPVSAITGKGIPELLSTLDNLLTNTDTKRDSGKPRLSIDRTFTMQGFGTVVTGTLIDGSLSVGQDIEILPAGIRSRIRGLQSHQKKVSSAQPGRRLAVNLSGVSNNEIQRGDVLTNPGWLTPTIAVDVRLRILKDSPRALKHNSPAHFHSGASESLCRIRLLESNEAAPGQYTLAQIRLENAMPIVKGDYFVIRSSDHTIGGGTVIETHAKRHKRNHLPTLERLAILDKGSDEDVMIEAIRSYEPCILGSLAQQMNLSNEAAIDLANTLAASNSIVALDSESISRTSILYSAHGWSTLGKKLDQILFAYHKDYPLRIGIQREELRSRLGLSQNMFSLVISRITVEGKVVAESNQIRLPNHVIDLTNDQENTISSYLEILRSDPYSPPTDYTIDEDLLNVLIDQGQVVRINETVIYAAEAYKTMVDTIISTITENGSIDAGQLRDKFGTSRKYALSMLEHLDQQRVTRRTGNERILRSESR